MYEGNSLGPFGTAMFDCVCAGKLDLLNEQMDNEAFHETVVINLMANGCSRATKPMRSAPEHNGPAKWRNERKISDNPAGISAPE